MNRPLPSRANIFPRAFRKTQRLLHYHAQTQTVRRLADGLWTNTSASLRHSSSTERSGNAFRFMSALARAPRLAATPKSSSLSLRRKASDSNNFYNKSIWRKCANACLRLAQTRIMRTQIITHSVRLPRPKHELYPKRFLILRLPKR